MPKKEQSGSKDKKRYRQREGATQMRFLKSTPNQFRTAISAVNALEEKEGFLRDGKLPEFRLKGSDSDVEEVMGSSVQQIRFGLFHHARSILECVVSVHGSLDNFVQAAYGEKISVDEAVPLVREFLQEHQLDGQLSVLWTPDLQCTGLLASTGPLRRLNMPERREYTLLLKSTTENNYLRQPGLVCLMYHEVGTHFMRAYNEGLQPWYSDRSRFGLSAISSIEMMRNEEGLATLHTVFCCKAPYLATTALSYYAACMAAFLDFKSLFAHLEKYVRSPESRWRTCLRIKRALKSPNRPGGIGKDQRYFEGAVEILTHMESIDFKDMMAGKLCWSELPRIRKLLRTGGMKLPNIMDDMAAYRRRLAFIRRLNGLADVVLNLETIVETTRQDLLQELLQYRICPDLEALHGGSGRGARCAFCCCFPRRKRSRRITPIRPALSLSDAAS